MTATVVTVAMLAILAGMLAAMAQLLMFFVYWFRAFSAGTPLPLPVLLGLKVRRMPVGLLVEAFIELRRRGREVAIPMLEQVWIDHRRSKKLRRAEDLIRIIEAAHRQPRST